MRPYEKAGRQFKIGPPHPTENGITTFTNEEYLWIKMNVFKDEHFRFLCDQKARDFRYQFVPDMSDEGMSMAHKYCEEVKTMLIHGMEKRGEMQEELKRAVNPIFDDVDWDDVVRQVEEMRKKDIDSV